MPANDSIKVKSLDATKDAKESVKKETLSKDSIATDSIAKDSTAVDTVKPMPKHVTWLGLQCVESQAPSSAAEREACPTLSTTYHTGMLPQPRARQVASDSGILVMLTALFLLVAFNFKHVGRLFKSLTVEMVSVRRRANAFDDSTANESRTLFVLLFQLWMCQGVLAYAWGRDSGFITSSTFFTPIVALIGIMAIFYVAQWVVYRVVGYTFTDSIAAVQWVKGYSSTQALLGFTLLVPALVTIFYPRASVSMIWTGVALYICSKIVFIIKGFRIFYTNLPSLLYFILYLCTLEIIPLILLILAVRFLGPFIP